MTLPQLPDGHYPFIDERLPLSELVMVEAPRDLEDLLKSQAAANEIDIVRDEPVEFGASRRPIRTRRFLFSGRAARIAFTCSCLSAL